jgi:hypothetical protein
MPRLTSTVPTPETIGPARAAVTHTCPQTYTHPHARTHTHAAGERLVACAGSHVVIGRVTLGHDTLAAIGEAGQTDGEPTKLVQACQPPAANICRLQYLRAL